MLPDLLKTGMSVVYCGTGAGKKSALVGQYYAQPGNKFWAILFKSGFTPREFKPAEYEELLKLGIGLTDLSKNSPGPDSERPPLDYDIHTTTNKILMARPKCLAFTSKKAASIFFGRSTADIMYGEQTELLGESQIYVLPSTSGAGSKYWSENPWYSLAEFCGVR